MEEILGFMDTCPVIEGKTILLRRITKRDALDMYRYSSDPRVPRYLLWSPHPSPEYTRRYLDEILRGYREHTFFDFAVVTKDENRMIGTCGFTRLDPVNRICELGYVLAPEYWHRGIATEAVGLILRYAFEELSLNRAEARYMVENVHSRAVMEKNGMVFEGVERDGVYAKGVYHDVGKCAILKRDYGVGAEIRYLLRYEPHRPFFLPR